MLHSHVERGGYKPALDLSLGCVASLGRAQSLLDGVDALIAEAGDLDVGTDLGRLRCQALSDVGLELLRGGLAGELDVIPNIGVAMRKKSQRVVVPRTGADMGIPT